MAERKVMTEDEIYDWIVGLGLTSAELIIDMGIGLADGWIKADPANAAIDRYCEDYNIDDATKSNFIGEVTDYSLK